MNFSLNPLAWTWDQWKAAGRHGLTALSASLATAVFMGIISSADSKTILANIDLISQGVGKIVAGVTGLITVLVPIYTALRAANSAKPENQAKATIKNLNEGVPLNGTKDQLINALANQPEVAQVKLVDKTKANELPSPKVV